jgi:alkylhydroperoxidase family enzyme
MILRGAHVSRSEYEWAQHVRFARAASVSDEEIEDIKTWHLGTRFSSDERAALRFMDAVMSGVVSDDVYEELASRFAEADVVELTIVAGAYAMVPRVLEVFRLPIEVP